MSGHNKWSQIKRQKGVADVKRSNVFTKLANAITIAAKTGKGLDIVMEQAKRANMPKDRIEKSIARGKGEIPGVQIEEITYEAYGPGGVAIIIKTLTDNNNRTISDLRSIMSKLGGNLANSGSVSYLFEQKGVVEINLNNIPFAKEDAELIIIDAGAEDFEEENGYIYVYTEPKKIEEVKKNLEFKALPIESAKIELNPKTYIEIKDDKKEVLLKLLETIENLDDIVEVYTNANL